MSVFEDAQLTSKLIEQRGQLTEQIEQAGYTVCTYQVQRGDIHHSQCYVCGHSLDAHCFSVKGSCAACLAEVQLLIALRRPALPAEDVGAGGIDRLQD